MKTKSNMTVKQKPKEPVKRILNKKPSTGNNLKECLTCGHVKKSNPTPDGDEICHYCGGDCLDYEPKELEWLLLKKDFIDWSKLSDSEMWPTLLDALEWFENNKEDYIQSLLTQQRTELLEEITDILDNIDTGMYVDDKWVSNSEELTELRKNINLINNEDETK